MNCNDVQQLLSEYLDGNLPTQQREAVLAHIAQCQTCNAELRKYQALLVQTTRLPKAITPSRDLWNGIANRIDQTEQMQHSNIIHRESKTFWRNRVLAIAATVLVMVGTFWIATRSSVDAWNVASLSGSISVGSSQVTSEGKLRVGEVLQTDATSRARVEVGLIGHVDVEPNSRLRLIDASLTDHRLTLDRGTIQATIWAPPRLFFVETPSALAVDLGCAYTLHVDSAGSSTLEVTSGWVALEFGGRESIVPAGNVCATRPGFGPGTPHREDASGTFKHALTTYDFEGGGADALHTVLANSRNMDSITLWHLLFRETGEQRAAVYDRLAELVPAPEGVTREGTLSGDREMIKAWQKHLNLGVKPWWKFWQM
ncbi:MAG: zf-HC2 domain-containing protein [Ignavibacteriae bacterium]|nr:zf-HC2 domain-containing protein [Ignavibacteriota bacterium]MCI0707917.1 zf-HC2 domain-containing protein [Ignavibacteriota bacterium]